MFCCLGPVRKRSTCHKFSEYEVNVLETTFIGGLKYPPVGDRLRMAGHLGLPERKIYVWFQNRRAAEKRKVKQGDR